MFHIEQIQSDQERYRLRGDIPAWSDPCYPKLMNTAPKPQIVTSRREKSLFPIFGRDTSRMRAGGAS
jgi:hypothetical protein